MQPKAIRGAIFDVDGTLLDSMYLWDRVGEDYLRGKGIAPLPDMEERVRTMSMMQIAQYCQEAYGMTEPAQQIIDEINGMVLEKYRNEVQPKPGVKALLSMLREKGVALAVATASDRCLIEEALERTGLLPYFDVFLTCSEVGAGKDSPAIFYTACKAMGTRPEETVLFEDSLYSMKTAKKEGFLVAAVFDESAAGETEEIRQLADWYVQTPEEWQWPFVG